MAGINHLSRVLIDTWLHSSEASSPAQIYSEVANRLSAKMALFVMKTATSDPYDWQLRRIRNFTFRSSLLTQMDRAFSDAPLGDLDRRFVDESIIPAYLNALTLKRPLAEMVRADIGPIHLGFERLILPQRTSAKPSWCISLIEARFLIPKMLKAKTDLIDDNVIQLLIEGHTTKEIADYLNLSPRTIEHRLGRLKDRFEAHNLVHLVARIVATQVSDTTPGGNGQGRLPEALVTHVIT